MQTGVFTDNLINSFWSLEEPDDDDFSDIVALLGKAEQFRTFSGGLTQLISEQGYTGRESDIAAKTDFLLDKLVYIQHPISRQTVLDWFSGKRRPEPIEASREKMFAVCFALHCSLAQVTWFFSHVYFDRPCNCRNIKELVYCYSFQNNYDYDHALQLIAKINTKPSHQSKPQSNNSGVVYTKTIAHHIAHIKDDDELIAYLCANERLFSQNNVSALKNIEQLLQQIKGKDRDRKIFDDFQYSNICDERRLQTCGLVVQECIKYKNGEKQRFANITSVDFMLDIIFDTSLKSQTGNFSFVKNAPLLKIIRLNFPTKKTFSDVLNKKSTSYDAIKKILILLGFYRFWFTAGSTSLHDDENNSTLFDDYLEETNDLLSDSGFDSLYFGNPYDWLFLYASRTERPLDTFRSIIAHALVSSDTVQDDDTAI